MKITIYELLGLIKDGKAPKKIKAYGEEYVWNTEYNSYVACDHDSTPLFNKYNINHKDFLTDEVEILDEPKEIDRYKCQTSQIPPWFRNEELIRVINENFELHTKVIRELINEVNTLKVNK